MHDFFPLNLLILQDTGSKWINLHRLVLHKTLFQNITTSFGVLYLRRKRNQCILHKNSQLWFNFPKPQLWTQMTQSLEAKQNKHQMRFLDDPRFSIHKDCTHTRTQLEGLTVVMQSCIKCNYILHHNHDYIKNFPLAFLLLNWACFPKRWMDGWMDQKDKLTDSLTLFYLAHENAINQPSNMNTNKLFSKEMVLRCQ